VLHAPAVLEPTACFCGFLPHLNTRFIQQISTAQGFEKQTRKTILCFEET
jgi:hypothetical protein